jgi:2-C-methyl-D-erythritol 4-phosphate cytidylyltransferase
MLLSGRLFRPLFLFVRFLYNLFQKSFMHNNHFISAILLAGGKGTRLGKGVCKQFRPLLGKPLALYSFELFVQLSEIDEIIVVCDLQYQYLFTSQKKPIRFAKPGSDRQGSVYNGLLETFESADLVCIHDSARPFVEKDFILALLTKAILLRAAALAIPVSNTIKQVEPNNKVMKTLPRRELWELQTPQAIRRDLFMTANLYAKHHQIAATDDLSLVEAMGEPMHLVMGSPKNFKITTPFDWFVAEKICASN